ncbi:MAG: TIGR00282 family metallophosphoesterase [Spirochaetales bacterium]|nr:TIGR00282 family metallophosphoesterase [Spirochaetales bacterium]
MSNTVRVLVLGDVVGQSGCRAIFAHLQGLKKSKKANVIIVNGENASDGRGITPELCDMFFSNGVNAITSGNHIWQQTSIHSYLDNSMYLLRPENYPLGVPGKGSCIVEIDNVKIGIVNLEGRVFMSSIRCPFLIGKEICQRLRKQTKVLIVDFHAEWPEEKEALGLYLDGSISALVGTHTHVQTADERILPGGTGYITDIGMTGPSESIIGMRKDIVIRKNLTQMPLKMEVEDSPADIMGVLLEIDIDTGKTLSIERIFEKSKV